MTDVMDGKDKLEIGVYLAALTFLAVFSIIWISKTPPIPQRGIIVDDDIELWLTMNQLEKGTLLALPQIELSPDEIDKNKRTYFDFQFEFEEYNATTISEFLQYKLILKRKDYSQGIYPAVSLRTNDNETLYEISVSLARSPLLAIACLFIGLVFAWIIQYWNANSNNTTQSSSDESERDNGAENTLTKRLVRKVSRKKIKDSVKWIQGGISLVTGIVIGMEVLYVGQPFGSSKDILFCVLWGSGITAGVAGLSSILGKFRTE